MSEERERKYLVQSEAWREKVREGDRYRQGYLSLDPKRSIRIRLSDEEAFLTIKGDSNGTRGGLKRGEFEYPIPVHDAEQMLEQFSEKPVIDKTRYVVQENGQKWEVDKFAAENDGLTLAEIENSKPPASLPHWIGAEVSDDSRYQNINLVKHPFEEWKGQGKKPEAKYKFKGKESVAEGVGRMIREQLNLAVWHLSDNLDSLDEAVHEARKSVKRIRSLLRLMRPVLGKTYKKENGILRDVFAPALTGAQGACRKKKDAPEEFSGQG